MPSRTLKTITTLRRRTRILRTFGRFRNTQALSGSLPQPFVERRRGRGAPHAVALADRVARQVVDPAILDEEDLERALEPAALPGRNRSVVGALLAVVAVGHGEGQRLEAGDLRGHQAAAGEDVGGDPALEGAESLSRSVSVDQVRVVGTGPAAGAGGDPHVARVRVLLQVPASAGRHRAQLRPAQVAGLGGVGVRGDHEHRRAHAVPREDRVGALVAVEAAVVERDQDRPVRELRDVPAGEARVLSDRDRVEAVPGQHRHLARELRLGDRVAARSGAEQVDPVVDEDWHHAAIVVDRRIRSGGCRVGAPDRKRSQDRQSAHRNAYPAAGSHCFCIGRASGTTVQHTG